MLLIRAVSFNGRPLGRDLVARFDEAGGTIGRGDSSTLVLPDPERFISRTHASISFQAGGFVITDNSTKNPILLNGRPMGPGSQARLGDGDQIQLGAYVLAVEVAVRSAPQAPPAETGAVRESGPARNDPWAAFKQPAANTPDPFADLLKPKPPTPVPPQPQPAVTPVARGGRPDPVADLQGREPSIDDVLGPKPPGSPDLIASEFRPTGPGRAGVVDPLEALGLPAKRVPPPTVPDHGQEVFTPFLPPVAKPDPAPRPRTEPVPPLAPPIVSPAVRESPAQPVAGVAKPVPPPAVAEPSRDVLAQLLPPAGKADPALLPRTEAAPFPAPVTAPPSPVERPAQPVRDVATGAAESTLLQALLRGAGIPDSPLLKSLTPETMETIGKVLREAVQGTLDLLRARGLTKSEMRADVTMIMPMDNNPLKFSPTVEAAMAHLLAPHLQGFMPPLRAVKNAYDDLRAHELGVLAGMRAALDEVLAGFAPEELKKRLSDPSVLDSVLPVNRKAKLWDLFVERYAAVAEEAREDFHAAFGKAFRRAYEAQVKQLRAEEHPG